MTSKNNKPFHIVARQQWGAFSYAGRTYCLKHLNAHQVVYKGNKGSFKFVVTYGLHCFTKQNQAHSIELEYADSAESRAINLERYHLSKKLRKMIENISQAQVKFYKTSQHKHFFLKSSINLDGQEKQCKVCVCLFKENRLLRLHVVSAFFEDRDYKQKTQSIFKLAMDLQKSPKSMDKPKEAMRS